MTISYAITCCKEFVETQRLVTQLLEKKRPEDEIVILFDSKNGDEELENYLRAKSVNSEFAWHAKDFEGHYANHKNYLNSLCSNDFIFQIDADEYLNDGLFETLPQILSTNDVELLVVPRINTVEGLTEQHVTKWRWAVDGRGWINFPDYQYRIYKNDPNIKWVNKVHEKIVGYDKYAALPAQEDYCLYHPKDIKRQEQQNQYYSTLMS